MSRGFGAIANLTGILCNIYLAHNETCYGRYSLYKFNVC